MLDFDAGWLQADPWVIAVVTVLVVAFLALAVWRGILVHRRQVSTGREDLIGKRARVRTALDPEGTVFVQGELWTAVVEEGRVEPGEEVIITSVDNLVLVVMPLRVMASHNNRQGRRR